MKPSRSIFAFLLGGILISLVLRATLLAVVLGAFLLFLLAVSLIASFFHRPGDGDSEGKFSN